MRDSDDIRVVTAWIVALAWGLVTVGCGGPQRIRHYQTHAVVDTIEGRSLGQAPNLTLAVEDFSSGAAYDEQRIAYRKNDYRVDYYHFHRWAAPPGMVVGETLRNIYRETGAFETVVGAYTTRADVVLSGRVLAFEEIDISKDEWVGQVTLDLRLRDAATGELLWTETIEKRRTLSKQNPVGLAEALSLALTEVGLASVDDIIKAGERAVRQRRRGRKFKGSSSEKSEAIDGGTKEKNEQKRGTSDGEGSEGIGAP